MPHLYAVDLNNLAIDRSSEVAQMLAGIAGASAGVLWTTQMRTAIRGGKPLGDPRLEDAPDSDPNE